ncbi:MAG: bifunctional sulfate adenylyltransferase subunit 1/adenylylsulfate kinase [Lentisphaerae bacterium RIFOXYB12_FULL_65_16]|nr:MAG: bifunctional sulfate adenylyltransferase subunit 1/adenylylsulfate kinase [Lentisphaerae bacterium RIFOXYA12_64_32]OGV93410.1 MAG: bifunctional sulfate adenylyltransferase subunit 1/adenylylsulfate kinase [Lentisphaerae bacterium RIFOXYB12_FULL_65_16]
MHIPDADRIRDDIVGYLRQHEEKDLLRLLTCGSVDDGKSTLIGRLLYDTRMIYEDQLAAVIKDSLVHGTTGTDFDPALLTDGLKAEREQGITIDVAYRYFSTSKRKFIIADTPGHEQYTRNMATGASNCNLAVVLIDARNGVVTQTKRHSFIVSLLGIRHVLVAINKMDLLDWSQDVYETIRRDYNDFVARLGFGDIHFIPISALHGDNIVTPSPNLPWYRGPTLLHHLENVNIVTDRNLIDLRFPVQYVIRPNLDFRGFAGTVASGVLRVGDEVMALPSKQLSRVKSIVTQDGTLDGAFPPMAVTVTLADEIELSRGSLLVHPNNVPRVDSNVEAMLVWMDETPAREGTSFLVKHATNVIPGALAEIRYRMDVNSMRRMPAAEPGQPAALRLNEIGRVHLTLHRPLAFDPYTRNRQMGAFILIDRLTNATVAAGMIVDRAIGRGRRAGKDEPVSQNLSQETSAVSLDQRQALLRQRGGTVWLTGLSGSGKSTIARELEQRLFAEGHLCYVLDGDNVRHGLNRDLGFSAADRTENIRRLGEVARLFNEAGVIVITAFISPYRQDRARARDIVGAGRFFEVFVDAPLEVCETRDPKGLYRKARAGQIPEFTGISAPYEAPEEPSLIVDTTALSPGDAAARIIECIAPLFAE